MSFWFPINMSESSNCCKHPICDDFLYRSLQVAMEDPACALDLKTTQIYCLHNSLLDVLSWIDKAGEPCSIVFPAVFDLHRDYTALEPYFSLLDDCESSVCSILCLLISFLSILSL